jgi:fission process protein 1
MALPAFTIHTAVKQASKRFMHSSNPTLRRWGPTAVGISIVPALPYLFDEPVEHVVDYSFDKLEHMWFKKSAAGAAGVPPTKPEL